MKFSGVITATIVEAGQDRGEMIQENCSCAVAAFESVCLHLLTGLQAPHCVRDTEMF